ncbi:MAG: dihydrolipoyl dehydrogenase [Clostridia bacterium BRH_c25]|nr:MAG: dihydrolipoyl dehydrogenase [Clostridia bacterium BRH_c25]
MAYAVIMPKAGMAMEEGTIMKWLKQEGDKVEAGEPLLEIHTDKVSMEVEAEAGGILLKILRQEGDVVPVTQTIAYIGETGEDISAAPAVPLKEKEYASKADKSDTFYDVIVIGGGPAGYVAAIKASQLGGRVALVEKDTVGGTCLNRGCIPTKAYLRNAELIDNLKTSADRGIILDTESLRIDMEKAVDYKNRVVSSLTTGVDGLLRSNNVRLYSGIGKISGEKQVTVNGDVVLDGGSIIVAGGSKAARISIPGIESPLVLTSDEALNLKKIPESLVIIGGGVIGIELATVFQAYGTQVTVVEIAGRILPGMDEEISETLSKVLSRKGIKLMTGVSLESVSELEGGLSLELQDHGALKASMALLSVGRVPDMEGFGNMKPESHRGRIKVNEYMETSIKGIYAPGDINGMKMLAHAAFKMGETAAENAMGNKAVFKSNNIPSCVYTIPEVASVGLTEAETKDRKDICIGKFPFSSNSRALAAGEYEGFVKVIADNKYGEILGVHIVGPGAAELINEAAVLMEMEITVHELSGTVHGHPTYSEAIMEAAADCLGRSIHLPGNS